MLTRFRVLRAAAFKAEADIPQGLVLNAYFDNVRWTLGTPEEDPKWQWGPLIVGTNILSIFFHHQRASSFETVMFYGFNNRGLQLRIEQVEKVDIKFDCGPAVFIGHVYPDDELSTAGALDAISELKHRLHRFWGIEMSSGERGFFQGNDGVQLDFRVVYLPVHPFRYTYGDLENLLNTLAAYIRDHRRNAWSALSGTLYQKQGAFPRELIDVSFTDTNQIPGEPKITWTPASQAAPTQVSSS